MGEDNNNGETRSLSSSSSSKVVREDDSGCPMGSTNVVFRRRRYDMIEETHVCALAIFQPATSRPAS